jgi:hypothetical protein
MNVFIDRVQLVRQGQLLKTYKVNFSTEGVSIAGKGIAILKYGGAKLINILL